MAVLVSALMAFGRLSADNEITALRATGVSPLRAMLPVLLVAAVLGAGLMWFNDKVLPEANHRAAALRNDIGRKRPTALIAPRRLIRDFEGYQIWINRVDDRAGKLHGVRIYQQDPGKSVRYTYADSASMEYVNAGKTILIHMRGGENHGVDQKDPRNYVRVRFAEQSVAIDNVDAALQRHERTYRTDREMPIAEMRDIVDNGNRRLGQLREEFAAKVFDDMRALDILLTADSGKTLPPRLRDTPWTRQIEVGALALAETRKREQEKFYHLDRFETRVQNEKKEIAQYAVEIHKKYAIPVATLVFVLVGAPLGVMARRGGLGTGVLYSLFFFLLYWVGMIRGEALADRLILSPWAAMWSPNALVGLGGLWLVWRMAREKYVPTRTPWQRLKGLFRRERPTEAAA
jgi:lipopolysaccharide export system permease protein